MSYGVKSDIEDLNFNLEDDRRESSMTENELKKIFNENSTETIG